MAVSLKQFYEELYLEHLEEGAYLYESLQPWREDPEGNWSDCAELEQRLETHIDALVIGNETARKILAAIIEDAGAGELFVITCVFCRLEATADVSKIWEVLIGSPDDLKKVATETEKAEEEPDPDLIAKIAAVAYALRLEYPDPMRSKLPKLLESPHGDLFPIIASTVDELGMLTCKSASNLLDKCPSWYLPQAARLTGNSTDKQCISLLEPLLSHNDPEVKKEAAIALLKQDHFDILPKLLETPEVFAIPLAFTGDVTAIRTLLTLAKDESPSMEVITALGFTGQLAAVKPLVLAMANEEIATAAANAAQLILATDLVEAKFVEETIHEEDLFEEELEAFKEGRMPSHPSGEPYGETIQKIVTDPECWREWLRNNRDKFDTQQAYRLGEPFSAKSVCRSLYKPGIPFELRRYIHDEMVIRFKLDNSFTVLEPVDVQMVKIQLIANWVQQS